jgi:hypothetical protein
MLLSGRTAQPSALTPLAIINDCLDQLEKLAAANLKGGVCQGEKWGGELQLRRLAVVAKQVHQRCCYVYVPLPKHSYLSCCSL